MTPEIEDAILTTSAVVSTRLYRRYRDILIAEESDLRQELWIWSRKKLDKIASWLDPEQSEEDYSRGMHALEKSMYRAGDRYCRTVKAKRAGYSVRDEVFYNTGVLEILLPEAWAPLHDVGPQIQDGVRAPSNPSEGGNRVATMIDIRKALKRLDPKDRALLELRFRDGFEPHEIAKMQQCSKATVYRNTRRALKQMMDFLGGESPWGR